MKDRAPNGLQLLIRAVVRDPDGKVLSDTGRKPARSFLIQFLEFLAGLFDGLSTNATDIDGAEIPIYTGTAQGYELLVALASVNVDNRGIVVGTGDTAPTNTDNKLETQLTEGAGAGQITHGQCTITPAAEVGANVDVELTRSFVNNTGDTILVEEAGVYTRNRDYAGEKTHCIIRDLTTTQTIPDKCALTVYYTFRTTV